MQELEDYVRRQGWEIVAAYSDVISGSKARRPGLDRLMADARQRKFDSVLVWKIFDREKVLEMRKGGASLRRIASRMGIGLERDRLAAIRPSLAGDRRVGVRPPSAAE
jgi:hypothetical protein